METSRTCAFASLTAAKSVAGDATGASNRRLRLSQILLTLLFLLTGSSALFAQEAGRGSESETSRSLPSHVYGWHQWPHLVDGRTRWYAALGLVFGLVSYTKLRNLPVHESMLEISELIYETCKTYLAHAG